MSNLQKLGIILIIFAYVAGTVYAKLGPRTAISTMIVGAVLLIFDEPAKAQ